MCVGAVVGVAVGVKVGVMVGASVGASEEPLRVKSAELLEPVVNVKGPATESPSADNRVHDAPFHPSPKLSSMLSVWEPEVRESVGFSDEK
jgi:hypothetical protein